MFAADFGDGSALGLELIYVTEAEPLGTGGGIRNVADRLTAETVMVFNGDVLSGIDLAAVVDTHRRTDADVTLHLVRVQDPRAFGCVPTDADGRVPAFLEKTEDPPTDQINAGCYVFRRKVIDEIPAGRPVSVERETFPGLLADGARVWGHVDSAYWLDLGTPADLCTARPTSCAASRRRPRCRGRPASGSCCRAPRSRPTRSCPAAPPSARCADRRRRPRGGRDALRRGRRRRRRLVRHSIIGYGAQVHEGAAVVDSVVGDRAVVGAHCELRFGARVWPDVTLPPHGVRFSPDV